jgi:hypothetical protein
MPGTQISRPNRLRNWFSRGQPQGDGASLNPLKLRGIDVAAERFDVASLADLGAAWGVNGGYAFYAAERWHLQRVVIVDEDLERYPELLQRADRTDAAQLVDGNFGEGPVATQVGAVDAVTMFDVLLHQVSPANWVEVLERYSRQARVFVLAGPWWTGNSTTRLVDLGPERYQEVVPDIPIHRELFGRLDEINPDRNLPWRDCHDVWQWGISDGDLRRVMAELGFELAHFEHRGPWTYLDGANRTRVLTRFFNGLYVYARADMLAPE